MLTHHTRVVVFTGGVALCAPLLWELFGSVGVSALAVVALVALAWAEGGIRQAAR